jgi:hypothetical protein
VVINTSGLNGANAHSSIRYWTYPGITFFSSMFTTIFEDVLPYGEMGSPLLRPNQSHRGSPTPTPGAKLIASTMHIQAHSPNVSMPAPGRHNLRVWYFHILTKTPQSIVITHIMTYFIGYFEMGKKFYPVRCKALTQRAYSLSTGNTCSD